MNHYGKFCIAALAVLLFGCANPVRMDRTAETVRFTRTSSGFEYVVGHDGGYPEDDKDAEKTRRKWMADYVTEVGLCKNGYKITKREVSRGKGMLGDVTGRIWYTGVCN